MINNKFLSFLLLSLSLASCTAPLQKTDYVNTFIGTTTLWKAEDLGYERNIKVRTWGGETHPGPALPNAMVQLSPVTQYRSGSGYQYEDSVIYGFSHTNKGHWNLVHAPMMPVTGEVTVNDYCSPFSHQNESARPGYYQVYLDRYRVNAELTSTLRCGYHKYTFNAADNKSLLVDITRSNSKVKDYDVHKVADNVFAGYQAANEKIYFYASCNYPIAGIRELKDSLHAISVVDFADSNKPQPLELKVGFSFVSIDNARMNLEEEMIHKDFAQVAQEANTTWNDLLGKIDVSGGSDSERKMFYSCFYRAFLWPALRSDVNGEYTDVTGKVVNNGFRYYTNPSFWDDYRNKLILLGMISPDVAIDV